jgi:predicted RNA binding protein YcfA (HicA-like mRNA interferase family)
MTHLPTYHPQRIIKELRKAGFIFDRQTAKHVFLIYPIAHLTICVPVQVEELKMPLFNLILQQTASAKMEEIASAKFINRIQRKRKTANA